MVGESDFPLPLQGDPLIAQHPRHARVGLLRLRQLAVYPLPRLRVDRVQIRQEGVSLRKTVVFGDQRF